MDLDNLMDMSVAELTLSDMVELLNLSLDGGFVLAGLASHVDELDSEEVIFDDEGFMLVQAGPVVTRQGMADMISISMKNEVYNMLSEMDGDDNKGESEYE